MFTLEKQETDGGARRFYCWGEEWTKQRRITGVLDVLVLNA